MSVFYPWNLLIFKEKKVYILKYLSNKMHARKTLSFNVSNIIPNDWWIEGCDGYVAPPKPCSFKMPAAWICNKISCKQIRLTSLYSKGGGSGPFLSIFLLGWVNFSTPISMMEALERSPPLIATFSYCLKNSMTKPTFFFFFFFLEVKVGESQSCSHFLKGGGPNIILLGNFLVENDRGTKGTTRHLSVRRNNFFF